VDLPTYFCGGKISRHGPPHLVKIITIRDGRQLLFVGFHVFIFELT
jgi:hypothetical protein